MCPRVCMWHGGCLTFDYIRDLYTLQSIYVFSFISIHVTWVCDLNTHITSLLILGIFLTYF